MTARFVLLMGLMLLVQPLNTHGYFDIFNKVLEVVIDVIFEDENENEEETEEERFSLDWLYKLLDLEDHCDPNLCQNNGTCEVKQGGFNCTCPEPYGGLNCQKVRNVCKGVKCGRGECVVKHTPPYHECQCRPPYEPPECTTSSPCNPSPCLNGGTCIKGLLPSRFSCHCPDNFTGKFCQVGPEDCYEANGETYRGSVSETEDGSTCLPWNAYFIIDKGYDPFSEYRGNDGVGPHNSCRNPDGDARPWCFTKQNNTLMWDYCEVQKCPVPEEEKVNASVKPTVQSEGDFATCGQLDTESARIYQGRKASPGDHPWQVSLQTRSKGSQDKFGHVCGGILIRSCWVLTAAHCIDADDEMQVLLGALNIRRVEPNTQRLDVVEVIVHEKYRETGEALYSDIALLRLQGTNGRCANETDYVKTVCLPDRPFPDGTECTISGWGATEKVDISRHLVKATVVLLSQKRCMADNVYGDVLDNSMLCAGNMKGGVDSCQGDSGGPLVCDRDETHYVYGVVSWGISCGKRNKPGLYARVTEFVDWINSKLGTS